MSLRVDLPRRPHFFALLRRSAIGLAGLGLIAVLAGVRLLEDSAWPLVGALVGLAVPLSLLAYLTRLRRAVEAAFLELGDEGLSVGDVRGVQRLAWAELAAVEVTCLGGRLLFVGRAGRRLEFPLASRLRLREEHRERVGGLHELLEVLRGRTDLALPPEAGAIPGGVAWRLLDWCWLFGAGFLALAHGLARLLRLTSGNRLVAAALGCLVVLGLSLVLRGAGGRRAATAFGSLAGPAVRQLVWIGLALALLAGAGVWWALA